MLLKLLLCCLLPASLIAQVFDSTFYAQGLGSVHNSQARVFDYEGRILRYEAPDYSVINNSEYGAIINLNTKTWQYANYGTERGSRFKVDSLLYTYGFNSFETFLVVEEWHSDTSRTEIGVILDRDENTYIPKGFVDSSHIVFVPDFSKLLAYSYDLSTADTLLYFDTTTYGLNGDFIEYQADALYAYAGISPSKDSAVAYLFNTQLLPQGKKTRSLSQFHATNEQVDSKKMKVLNK